jgi:dTMP kinase
MNAADRWTGGTAPGAFITFEGGEGTGKSTQIRLLAERLEAAGLTVRVLREPGGTVVGEAVRRILLDPDHAELGVSAEILLYEASRAQLVDEVIRPALTAGEVVLCDRFFDSTTAYQGYARGIDLARIDALNEAATGGLVPDRTLVLDIDPAVGVQRATAESTDRLEAESLGFHVRVREGFLAIADQEPGRMRVIDASGSAEQVAERVADALADLPALAPWLGGGR